MIRVLPKRIISEAKYIYIYMIYIFPIFLKIQIECRVNYKFPSKDYCSYLVIGKML